MIGYCNLLKTEYNYGYKSSKSRKLTQHDTNDEQHEITKRQNP